MPRQFSNMGIGDLEKLFDQKRDNIDVLTSLLGELSHRTVPRARALRRRVMQALSVVKKDATKTDALSSGDAALLDLTPAQHRRVAEVYRQAGPDWTAQEREHAAKLAEHHEMVAKGMERRLGRDG